MKNSKHTLSANIVNQISGMLIFLTIPNILSQEDYAQTVYIAVLMSFMVLSDFGMGFVYGRTMPSIYHKESKEKIEEFNQTFFWFRIIMSIIGSIIIGIIYYTKYDNLFNAILLIFLNPLTIVVSFFIQQYSVREDFLVYRNINIKNAFARVLIIPMAYVFGIGGWISSQAIVSLTVIKTIKTRVILGYEKFNLLLIKEHFFEALVLLANFFFWHQLLNSGRLYATIYFDDDALAQYGITNAGYSLLLTLMISIFLPVTVATLKIMQEQTKDAIEQLFGVIIKTSVPLFIVVVLAIELAPYLYKMFFPKYDIDFEILKYQLLSLMALPFVVTLGNIFLGLKQPVKLLIIYASSFMISFVAVNFLIGYFDIVSAALAQLIGITFLGIILLGSVMVFYGDFIENRLMQFTKLAGSVFLPYIFYWIIKGLI